MHQRGLADSRIARHQQQGSTPRRLHGLETRQHLSGLRSPAKQLRGRLQTFGPVSRTQHEGLDDATRLPLCQTMLQVVQQALRPLVALFRHFRQQLRHESRKRWRNTGIQVGRRARQSGDMAMHQFQGIPSLVRQLAGEHLVQRDAKRIKVGPQVDRTAHAPGLLGRDVGPVAHCRTAHRGCFDRLDGREVQVDQTDFATGEQHQVGRPDVAVDDLRCVQVRQDARELARQPKARCDIEPLTQQDDLQGLCVHVLQDHCQALRSLGQRNRLDYAGHIQAMQEVELSFERLDARRDHHGRVQQLDNSATACSRRMRAKQQGASGPADQIEESMRTAVSTDDDVRGRLVDQIMHLCHPEDSWRLAWRQH